MAGLPVDRLGAVLLEHFVGGVEAGRLDVDDEGGVLVDFRQVAGQHQADFVGEDFLAGVVDHAAAVAVTVEAERQVGTVFLDRLGHVDQHFVVFGVRVVLGEGRVERGVELDDFGAHGAQGLGREGAGRAVAAGADDLELALQLELGGDIVHVALLHAFDAAHAATRVFHAQAAHDDFLQPAHFVRTEGQRRLAAHLDAGPAVVVVRGGDHGDAGRLLVELGEVGDRRQAQADIDDLDPGLDQADDQGVLDVHRIRAVVVAGDQLRLDAALADIGAEAQAQRRNAKEVDFLAEDPARVIFAEARRLDEHFGFEGVAVFDNVGLGL